MQVFHLFSRYLYRMSFRTRNFAIKWNVVRLLRILQNILTRIIFVFFSNASLAEILFVRLLCSAH